MCVTGCGGWNRGKRMAPRSTLRIVVARPDHLGDVLLTLPAVMALRQAVPAAHISLLVALGLAPVARRCPAVDDVYLVPFPALCDWPEPLGWAATVAQQAARLHGCFDLALLPRPDDPISGALLAAAEVPFRWGYAAPRTRPFLTQA